MLEKVKSNSVMQKVIKFYDSNYYPLIIFSVVLLSHCLAIDVVGILLVFLSACFTNLFCDDIRSSLPVVFMGPLCVSTQNSPGYGWSTSYYSNPINVGLIVFICTLTILTLIVRILLYKEYKNLFTKRFLLLGFLFLAFAYITSGLFSKYYNFDNLMIIAVNLICHTLGYLLYSISLSHRKDNVEYLAKVSVLTIILIIFEILFVYILRYEWGAPLDSDWKDKLVLGVLVSNSAGEFIAIFLPFCFYLCCTQKRGYLYYILSMLSLVAIYFTLSRTALLFSIPTFLLGSCFVCFIGKNKKICRYVFATLCLAGLGLFLLLLFKGYILKLATFFINAGFSDRTRFRIWSDMLNYFTEFPIFGVGFSAYFNERQEFFGFIYRSFAHNTIIQFIASTGIIGTLIFLYHRFETFKMFFTKLNFAKFFILLAVLVFMFCGLLDQIFIFPNFAILYTILLTIAEKETVYEIKLLDKKENI